MYLLIAPAYPYTDSVVIMPSIVVCKLLHFSLIALSGHNLFLADTEAYV